MTAREKSSAVLAQRLLIGERRALCAKHKLKGVPIREIAVIISAILDDDGVPKFGNVTKATVWKDIKDVLEEAKQERIEYGSEMLDLRLLKYNELEAALVDGVEAGRASAVNASLAVGQQIDKLLNVVPPTQTKVELNIKMLDTVAEKMGIALVDAINEVGIGDELSKALLDAVHARWQAIEIEK